jgi:erythromycin esterase
MQILAQDTPASAPQSDAAFLAWAQRSLHPIASLDMNAPMTDLKPLRKIIGNAKIVMLSEATHFGAEPLEFRNRLFGYLVEELGFNAIAIESGITESRVVHDYVQGGPGDLHSVVSDGFSWAFDLLPQNEELVRWMREYNADPRHARKIEFFGFDVPGSPTVPAGSANIPLDGALRYLQLVDPAEAEAIATRLDRILPSKRWNVLDYLKFSQATRDALTAVVADARLVMEARQIVYLAKSSKADYAWGYRDAIGAREVDDLMRRIPVGAKERDYRSWIYEQGAVRDRAMAANARWIIDQLGPEARVLFFAQLGHIATAPVVEDGDPAAHIPFGTYMKERYSDELLTIGHIAVQGQIGGCGERARGRNAPVSVIESKPIAATSATAVFAQLNKPLFLLDLRRAPASATWLRQTSDLPDGFGSTSTAISNAFDVLFFSAKLTPACETQR